MSCWKSGTAASTSRSGGVGHRRPAAWPAYMSRYKQLEWLGAGKNGEVFKAWDTMENRIVAAKRLSATGTDGGDSLMFSGIAEVARETRYLHVCQDIPSVVRLWDKVVPAIQSGDSFIIMDYAGRLNLRSYMQRRAARYRRFSEAEVRRIMKLLLEGVSSVHGKGIAHLDIRPENVIVDDGTEDRTQMPQEGAPIKDGKLEDDSITYKIGGFAMSRMKERPEVLGLTPYSAPELLLRSREYDERVDTWGLGCIMADLLSGTGKPTFGRDGDSDEELMSLVFDTVDVQGIKDWPGYSGIAADAKSKLPKKKGVMEEVKSKLFGGPLRLRFPVWRLSSAGFKVLSGLLETNPAKRLTAAGALQMPWFQQSE